MYNAPSAKPRKARGSYAPLITSWAAVVIALGSLGFAIFQGTVMMEHNRLSVRPLLEIDRFLVPISGHSHVGIYLRNVGNGIALIDNCYVRLGDRSLEHDDGPLGAIAELMGTENPALPRTVYVGPRFGAALRAGEHRLLLGIDATEYLPEHAAVLEEYIFKMEIGIEYHSLYNELFDLVLEPSPD